LEKKTMPQDASLLNLTKEEFDGIVSAANGGDANALQRLRELLDGSPDVWQRLADLSSHALAATIASIAGGNTTIAESLRRKVEEMRQELQHGEDGLLHRLAVDRLIACWLAVQLADRRLLEAAPATPLSKYWSTRQEKGARMYDLALRSLADVRRLHAGSSMKHRENGIRMAPETLGEPSPAVAM
jgi:hypothetical protein